MSFLILTYWCHEVKQGAGQAVGRGEHFYKLHIIYIRIERERYFFLKSWNSLNSHFRRVLGLFSTEEFDLG